ncbi:MAG: Rab family GTPase [Mariprofundaceae bacterium]|nr:Rab family GTPase [Mariprofundaceae bacterium]
MIQKKICVLGAAGVGKTSLIAQFVYSKFSEKYLSSMGVKIDRKIVQLESQQVNLMIWDIHGEEKFKKITSSYFRGASGVIMVADGTRPDTLSVAQNIFQRVEQDVGNIPSVWLLNKVDLEDQWCMSEGVVKQLNEKYVSVYQSSAKTGENVEQTFFNIAENMLNV